MTTFTAKTLSDTLYAELEKGYNVVRISRVAFQIYQEHGRELTPELNEKILQLLAMEEGPEFEYSEVELRKLAEDLSSQ